MGWVVWVEDEYEGQGKFGQAIGPFALEADADKRAEEECLAREPGSKVQVTFLVQPDWVAVGKRWHVPFEIVHQVGGKLVGAKIEVHYPFGKYVDANQLLHGVKPNLDNL